MPKLRLLWVILLSGTVITSTGRLSWTQTVSVRGRTSEGRRSECFEVLGEPVGHVVPSVPS